MKKLLLFWFLIPCFCAISQTTLLRFEENNKTGYKDSLQRVVVKPVYDHGEHFSEGLATVHQNGKTGYIDQTGNMVIPPQFNMGKEFHEGVAIVMMGKTFGLIDRKGNYILQPVYQYIQFQREGKIGVKQNDLWGFYTIAGKPITSIQYEWIGAFSEGLAMVQSAYDGKYGFIDPKGALVIPMTLTGAFDFHDGYASVHDSLRRPCFIDRQGRNVFGKYYYNISSFSEGRAFVQEKPDSHGYFIDTQGRPITDPVFRQSWSFQEGFCGAVLDSEFVVLDTNGTVVFRSPTIELRFYAGEFGFFYDHSGPELTWGTMNRQQQIISERRFTRVEILPSLDFVEVFTGISGEVSEGKHGYMNLRGVVLWEETVEQLIPIH